MKKSYLIAILLLIANLVNAQIERTHYRGAFAPAPTAMWTDSWTNWNPKNEPYTDAATVVNVTTDITANTTWTTGKTYKLNGLIYVRNNATLTIQPGVVIKGIYSSNGTALVITKGAKLNAIGTAASPIVFTSAKAVGSRQAGDWGGIILLGKGGFNLNNGVNNIEGITATVNTEYGGGTTPNDNDNSGTLKYVRIEFGGFVFSPNNEINGLTFGAVGRGTTIDYVQVSYSGDDSYEWFGGAVNCKHLVAYRGLDDDFDTDNGFKGIVQFALGVRDPAIADNPSISTSEGFESDNNASTLEATSGYDNTTAIFTNCTLIGPSKRSATVASGFARALRLRRSTELKIYNSVFLDFKNNYAGLTDDQTIGKYYSGKLKLKNNIFAGFYGSDFTNFPNGINPVTKTGTTNTAVAGGLPVGQAFDLGAKMSADGNIAQASSDNVLASPYNSSDYTVYSGLDYRAGTAASTGADFTDESLAAYIPEGTTPVVANVNYCKGVVASPLTATLTTNGVSLLWYTVATGGTSSTTAPTPLTTAVGTKSYWVSQLDEFDFESDRVKIDVIVNALPTEVVSTITGTGPEGSTSAVYVGKYVGTTSVFTYSVNEFADNTLSYLWTVPNGVNIISGQGTNTLTVNYKNVSPGAGSVGSIQLQAVNASGCKTVAKTLGIAKALPAAPAAINMYNLNDGYATPATAITTYGLYMGKSTPLTLTATAVADAAFYKWELPSGVNVITSGTPVVTNVTYSAEPFVTPGNVPSTVGTKYWVVTTNKYVVNVNGVSTSVYVSTASQKIFGSGAYGSTTSQPYAPYGTVVLSDNNSILVNFLNLTNPATTALYFGAKSVNGVGASVTNNSTNADVTSNASIPGLFFPTYTETYNAPIAPSTNATSSYAVTGSVASTAKLKKLTAAIPAAPSALKLTNDAVSTTLAVTTISKYVGTTTPLTLTATASATANSYVWELPSGVNQLSGGTTNVITVNFSGVAPGATTLYLGVKSVNGIGTSVTNNSALTPATSSTAKLLKVTTSLPAAVSAVSGQITGLCAGSSHNYTMTASALANSYVITSPVGTVITSESNASNTSNTISTSDLMFSVSYPAGFVATTAAPKSIIITSVNGVGNSATNKTLVLSTLMPSIGTATGSAGITEFTRCANQTFTVPAIVGATNYTWVVVDGAVIVNGQGTNSVEVDFSGVSISKGSNVLKVSASNSCSVSSAVKSITLTSTECPAGIADENETESKTTATQVTLKSYPNPFTSTFKLDLVSNSQDKVEVIVYDMSGNVVEKRTVKSSDINNVELGTNYRTGIYNVIVTQGQFTKAFHVAKK